ncbi:MAG: hypothetical protein IKM22_04940 [Clostridia bacterium]|nr:hypothetical protein [Clostridia bacterium]
MKKQYGIPELDIIVFDIKDIITHSLATEDGDNIVDASEEDWFGNDFSIGGDGTIHSPWGKT